MNQGGLRKKCFGKHLSRGSLLTFARKLLRGNFPTKWLLWRTVMICWPVLSEESPTGHTLLHITLTVSVLGRTQPSEMRSPVEPTTA